ncbi:MAG: hypothetical protein AAF417_22495 [Pseudomonadota bacterium]
MAIRLGSVVLLLFFVPLPASADTAEDLDKWFRDGYAALYAKDAWDRSSEFAQYFADEIAYRSDEGLDVVDVNEFVVDSLDEWRSQGWLATDVAKLDTGLLNATTALFAVKWSDRNDDGSTELSCGWYIADKIRGEWLLSQYIAMACSDEE